MVRVVVFPKVGSTVLGQVQDVQSRTARLRISKVGENAIAGFFSGILHISDVSPGFVENMFEVCKKGDLMRAKVISDKNRVFHLSTADKNLGVVYAFCSRCGHLLPLKGQRVRCSSCDKIEKRKVASDYDEVEI
jgi:exosome complex component CSL4